VHGEVLPVNKIKQLPQDLTDSLQLPAEAVLGSTKLTVVGGKRALVENHRGVLAYSTERIVISTGHGKVNFCGTGLNITAMNKRELLITGRIQSVEFE
jgi:sporulation protein YqfC